jgi:hypothetical protein
MTTPDSLETQHTLTTAVARYNDLRARDLLASAAAGLDNDEEPAGPAPLPAPEALELLALSEVIARKAGYGRQLTIRSARVAGASWSQIGAALGTSKQSAWEAHSRWIDQQAELHGRIEYKGMDDQQAAARALAGAADEER